MNDILPPETAAWQRLEATVARVVHGYGYQEIRMPILEPTELFARSIGDLTDIVQKEMYTFQDRNGDSLTLRPEGTAGCVRAALEHGLLQQQPLRLWYRGPMFRHERPQKGRYRQFHQVGVEALGIRGPDIDAELILMSARLWRALGIDGVRLEINSLGTPPDRARYREALRQYFGKHIGLLDEDGRKRLELNPLRLLDSKDPALAEAIAAAPSMDAYLNPESSAHFERLKELLDATAVACRRNPRLVRGLDYYSDTVFEWVTDKLGAQGTVCAGGRYDGLVEQLGGPATPAAGFAMGLERLLALCPAGDPPRQAACYIMPVDAEAQAPAAVLAERLRDAMPNLPIMSHLGGGSLKSQMKKADRSGAALALLIGADERRTDTVTVKFLREERAQLTVPSAELVNLLARELRL